MVRVLALRALLVLTAILALPCSSALAAPPANDDLAGAELIEGTQVSVPGSVVDATKQIGEPNHASDSEGRSIWYRWTAPGSGTLTLNTVGSTFPTTLAVYGGTDFSDLTRLAAVDAQVGERSRLSVDVTQGTTYLFAVDIDYGTPGAVTLNLAFGQPPANDAFAAPAPLSGLDATASADTTFAVRDAGDPTYGASPVWYSWTAPSDGSTVLDTAGSAYDTVLAVFTGNTPEDPQGIAWNDNARTGVVTSRTGFRARAGTTYRILVGGNHYAARSSGPMQLALRHRTQPANDSFSAATVLPPEASVLTAGDNQGATAETAEPRHFPYDAAQTSVWYSWTAPKSGSLTIRSSAAFTAALAAYRGDTVAELARVANQAQDWNGGPEQIRIRVEAGVTYRIAVDGLSLGGEFGLSLQLSESPVNDDFAQALPLTGLEPDAAGSTIHATQEPCEPVHDDNYYDPSVWYTWTAPASGGVTVDTAGSDFPTVLGIYTGDALCTLTRVPVDRLTGIGVPAKRTFRATAGVTYRIAVDGQRGKTGSFKLSLRHSPPPANDLLANAEPLAGASVTAGGSLLGATGEAGEPNPGGANGATVWYAWTAPTTGPTTVRLPKQNFSAGVSVHTGTSVGSLTRIASSSYAQTSFRATAGTPYLIAVDGGTAPRHGDFTLELSHLASPPNDDFDAAEPLSGTTDSRTGSTLGASAQDGEPAMDYYSYAGGSVWYSWTAPSDGTAEFDTNGSAIDTVAGVYTGASHGALTALAVNDNATAATKTSRVTFRAKAGTTYRFAVRGTNRSSGDVRVSLNLRTGPANDAFDAAVPLSPTATAAASTNTLGATAETGEPSHYSYDSSRASVWYAWTAPSGGSLTIRATSNFQPVLAAYTGGTLSALTRVRNQAQDWNGGPEQIRVRVEAGTTYYIAVDALGSLGGALSLSLQLTPSPANDDFANPAALVGLAADVASNTFGATQELCEPVHDDNYYDPSVWYTWTAPASGPVTLDTIGSDFPTVVAAYLGDDLCNLLRVPLRRMSAAGVPAKRGFRAVAGRRYRIAVDGMGAKMGNFKLALRQAPPPANDMLANAQPLSGAIASATGSNFGATAEPGEPNPGGTEGATVWYSWTAPASGLTKVQLPTDDFDAKVAAYTGDTPGALTRVGGSSYYPSMHFRAVAGTTYRIAVDGGVPAQGDFTLKVTSLAAAANDDFANAVALTGATGRATGTTAGATMESGEPSHDYYSYYYERSSVWYSWTAPSSGFTVFNVANGSGHLATVYSGDSLTALSRRASGGSGFQAVEGTTYRIAVTREETTETTYSSFGLTWQMVDPPANDAFASAVQLSGAAVSRTGTTVAATSEPGEPATGSYGDEGGATVWYAWTAPATGLVGAGTSDGRLGVYRGGALGSLELLGSARYSSTHFRAVEGTTYYLRVEGDRSRATAAFTVSLKQVPRPANDDFEDAAELSGSASGTTTGAGAETGEPLRSSSSRATVWYSWTPSSSGTAVIGAGGSHAISAYTGDALASLTRRATAGYGQARFRVIAGTTYRIAIDSEETTSSRSFNLSASVVPGPPNDDFADAAALAGAADSATGSHVNATTEPGEPHSYSSANGSVWYRWTAPSNGQVAVDLSGSSFDTDLSAHTGDSIGALTDLGRDSDGGEGTTSRLTIPVRAGTTYSFAVRGYYSTGTIKLALAFKAAPANDDFEAAVPLSGRPVQVTGSNVASTREPNEPANTWYSYGGGSVWYAWTAEESGRATVDLSGSGFAATIGVYEGSAVGALRGIASAYSGGTDSTGKVSFNARRGVTYRISVDGYYGSAGAIKMALSQADAPPNDDFDRAQAISGRTALAAGTNAAATQEPEEPYTGSGSASVWYRWTAPASGTVAITARDAAFSTSLRAYTGASFSGLRLVASGSSSLRFYVTAGSTYSIALNGAYANASGTFNLDLALEEPPGNDLFQNATPLLGPAVDVSGSTRFATQESCEPVHDDNYYDPSVWFSWKAPADGRVTLDTAGSTFATVLGIYTGDYLCSLTRSTVERLSAIGEPAKRAFQAKAGVTYRIAVDGQRGVTGDYKLSLRQELNVPPKQDDAPPPAPVTGSEPGSEPGEPRVETPPQQPQPEDASQDPPGDPVVEQPAAQDPPAQDPPAQDPPADDQPTQDAPAQDPPAQERPYLDDPPTTTPPSDPPAQDSPSTGPAPGDPPSQSAPREPALPPSERDGASPPTAPAGPTAPPAPTPEPLRIAAAFPAQKLANVLTKGLQGSVTCSSECSFEVVVTLDEPTARKLRLRGSKLLSARISSRASGTAPAKIAVRLPKALQQKLSKAKALPLTVRIAADGAPPVTRKLTLKR